jgi:hypothetical protein
MFLIADKAGQLANRLFLFSHFIGTAVETGVEVWNPAFEDYADYFPSLAGDIWCRFPPKKRAGAASRAARHIAFASARYAAAILYRLRSSRVVRINYDLAQELTDARLLATARQKVVFMQGWQFRNTEAVLRNRDLIRDFFKPAAIHAEGARRTIERARSMGRLVIGVHVRQGDYRSFHKGRYYYDVAQYACLMRNLQTDFAESQPVFLVCSDEKQAAFDGINHVMGPGHLVEDLYSLAQCDLLIGPPSTFSMWAAFYGDVPLFHLLDVAARPTRADFKRYSDFDPHITPERERGRPQTNRHGIH